MYSKFVSIQLINFAGNQFILVSSTSAALRCNRNLKFEILRTLSYFYGLRIFALELSTFQLLLEKGLPCSFIGRWFCVLWGLGGGFCFLGTVSMKKNGFLCSPARTASTSASHRAVCPWRQWQGAGQGPLKVKHS